MQLLMIKSFIVLCACSSATMPGDETHSVQERIDALIKDGQFEAATAHLQRELAAAPERSTLLLQMSCVEIKRARFQQAFGCFWKALNALPAPVVPQTPCDASIEKLLDIASVMRTHRAVPVASAILNALGRKYPGRAPILYETANLHLTNDKLGDFFECFYRAYEKEPGNVRALPGLATVRAVAAAQVPKPNDFPWLAAAAVFYDNPRIWQNVLLTLDRFGVHEQEAIDALAKTLPDHVRPVFYYYYHRHSNRVDLAVAALAGLDRFTTTDLRLRLCRDHLLVSDGRTVDSLARSPTGPMDFYERLLFQNLRVTYHEHNQWQEPNFVNAYEGFLSVLTEATQSLLDPNEVAANRNYLWGRWATNMATNWSIRQAIRLLEGHQDSLSDTNLSLLTGFYLSVNDRQNAIRQMEEAAKRVPEPRARLVQAILDYALLADDRETFQRWLSKARGWQIDSVVQEYPNSSQLLERPAGDAQKVLSLLAYPSFEAEDWRQWTNFGPCAYASVSSVLEYWKKDIPYGEVKKALNQLAVESAGSSLARLLGYLRKNDLRATFLAPSRTVATHLLSHGIPILLVGTRLGEGIFFGHISVVYAHDDRIQRLFLKDSSEITQERRLPCGGLFGETAFLVAVPRGSRAERDVQDLDPFEISAWDEPLSDERIQKLTQQDPLLAWWARRYNADLLDHRQDARCVAQYEKCLEERQPTNACFYRQLAEACLTQGDRGKAMEYIQRGLAMEPESLELLALSVQVTAGPPWEDYKADAAQTGRLLETTRAMEKVNSAYPLTYFLRGDIYARGFRMQRKQETLTAFQRFLETYEVMNETWKRAHVAQRDHAVRTVQLCRRALAERGE
jgi:hypothetical protein